MARQLNSPGSRNASTKIAAGSVSDGAWSFSGSDGDKLLGADGSDWAEYARWFLGENTDQTANTKARYSYPFGKGGQVYVAALRAIRARASQQGDTAIFERAGALLDAATPKPKAALLKQMPIPAENEDQTTFTGRCLADDSMLAQYSNPAERAAMCEALWNDSECAEDGMDGNGYVDGDMQMMSAGPMRRGYMILNVKDLNEPTRTIRGTATTPTPDRIGDVVEPMGAEFRNPLPLLWQHNETQPVGVVRFDTPTSRGINFEAQLPRVLEPGVLRDRVDEAWQSVQYGLVSGASIGFRPKKDGFELMDAGGIRFKSIEILELSLVTVPANQDCSISLVKSIDRRSLAALGKKRNVSVIIPPGASGDTTTIRPGAAGKPNPATPSIQVSEMRNLAEQISALEATRAAKSARMSDVMNMSIGEGRSSDEAEAEEFDTIELEVAAIDKDLVRLRKLEAMNAHSARPVTTPTAYPANGEDREVRGGNRIVAVRQQLPPGIEFARHVMCLAAGRGNLMQAAEIAKNNFGESSDNYGVLKAMSRIGTSSNIETLSMYTRAAVQGATSSDSDWAGPLVFAYPRFTGDFVEYLRPRTILGNITGMTQIPFNVNIAGQTTGGTAYWVGEGKPKPLTSFSFNSTNLRWAKVATISVITEEMARFSSPSAETLVRNELVRSVAERMDIDFVDPTVTATTNVRPASVTNGVSPIVSVGNDGEHVRTDIANLMATFDAANISLRTPFFVMSMTKARALALMRNALGQREFPDMNMTGIGSMLEGVPVVVSQYVTRFGTTGGELIVLMNAEDIWFADDGQVTIDASREASLEMLDSSLLEEASGGTGASLVSMFQNNSIAIRAERYVNWQKRRPAAVAVLGNVFWGHATMSGT